ncbi:FecR family protein [Flavobacteriaceae bacterium MAR_2009_75]|nr:FecR family protein [Flavobacteriaceae bacterium MAR_2009_75]
MNKKEAKNLFKKYLNNECTSEEIQLLYKFLESYQNDKGLDDNEFQKSRIWKNIEQKALPNKNNENYFFKLVLRYAAVFVGLFGLVYTMFWFTSSGTEEIQGTVDAILVKTSDNQQLIIRQNDNRVIRGNNGDILGRQAQDMITYENNDTEELVYNKIWVPHGKKFKLKLSDGTFVHLNSGSSLKYPIGFAKKTERRVFLKGEAYFEVAKDSNNPFKVVANEIDVNVLGTHFNVSNYDEEITYAVLAEGSVQVSHNTKNNSTASKILEPGEMASLEKDALVLSKVTVEDYINWRNGNLSFHNEHFGSIVKKIERHYNVVVKNEYSELNNQRFRGIFRSETIVDLLETFKESAEFDYLIDKNQIIIKKPN